MSKSTSTFSNLKESFSQGKIPGNIFLICPDKVLSDELVDSAFEGFVGKGESKSDCMASYTADDLKIESLMNEAIGGGLFSLRKLILLRNPGKLNKAKRAAMTEYLASPNPDVLMVIISDEDEDPGKIVFDASAGEEKLKAAAKNLSRLTVEELSEQDMIKWVRAKFEDFEVDEEAIMHLLSLSNNNLGEILSEITKLKTFCHFKKAVSIEDINMCNGIAKDFNEGDFLRAVIKRDPESAYRIYHAISLKKDIEVYLIFLLNTAFCAIRKLEDPASLQLQGFPLKKELKLWGPVQEAMMPLYKEYLLTGSTGAADKALSLIYDADKRFKSSSAEKSVVMTSLIHRLCSI